MAGAEFARWVFGRTKPRADFCDFSDDEDEDEDEGGDAARGMLGAGDVYRSSKERMYALSALGTGSPSLMNDRNRDFFSRGVEGLVRGSRETGGAPKVRQWMRLKQPVRILSSLFTSEASMWA